MAGPTAGRVLDDLDFVVHPGERVGLVGRSGAGKSTLVNLLLRFYESNGRIRIDGQDIGGVTQESLRSAIGVVTQDTSLLHRSIADNIRYGRPAATDAEIIRCAERPRARVHPRPAGLEGHRLRGPRGRTWRQALGGQRQRIALARVILKDAPILVLDEATSALDSEIEAAIQEQLCPDGRQDRDRDRAPPEDDRPHGPPDRARRKGASSSRARTTNCSRLQGHYEKLWRHQSGGFLAHDMPEAAAAATAEVAPLVPAMDPEAAPVLEDGPVDDMRAAEQPEPSINDEPIPLPR